MKICGIQQLDFKKATDVYDVVIASSGYESRARFVSEKISQRIKGVKRKFVFAFTEHSNVCARTENDCVFEALGYIAVPSCGGSDVEVVNTMAAAFAELPDEPNLRVLVDMSSMTRVWYGAVVRFLLSQKRQHRIVVHFSYTAAEFTPPSEEYPPNRVVAPVPGFTGNTLPDKPTALVLGLGYDTDRAVGLKDHLDPQLTVLFYADPASDPRYTPHVLDVNKGLMREVGEERIFTYPFFDCAATFRFLDSLCKGLTHDWRVVLCSLGPKVFGLCSFLAASVNKDISIWRVSADSHELPFDHKAFGTPILLETIWE